MLAGVGLLLNVSRGAAPARRASRRAPVGDCASSTAGASPGEPPAPRPRGAPEPVPPPARVVIAAGGTAGHVVPALAVADALRAEGAEVSFLGARRPRRGRARPGGWLRDRPAAPARPRPRQPGPRRRRPAPRRCGGPRARAACCAVARRARCSAAADTWPARRASPRSSLRLPLVLTEADRHLGLANRLLARRARRVCLAFPIDGLVGDRYLVTGRPVPAAVLAADRDAARERFGIAAADVCLLVFGGSQGARSINLAALEAFSGPGSEERDVPRPPHQRQPRLRDRARGPGRGAQPGPLHAARVRAGTRRRARRRRPRARALRRLDLRDRRRGRPSILVPYPYASGRHQHANAEWMARRRGGPRDRGRRARPGGAAASSPAGCSADPRPARGDGGCRRPARAPARCRRRSRRSCSPRSANLRCDERRLERARAALHRDRRRRDERPGARLPPARRRRSPAPIAPRAHTWNGCAPPGSSRGSATIAELRAGGRRGRRLDRDRRGQPRARPRPRARPAGDPPRRAARRAVPRCGV